MQFSPAPRLLFSIVSRHLHRKRSAIDRKGTNPKQTISGFNWAIPNRHKLNGALPQKGKNITTANHGYVLSHVASLAFQASFLKAQSEDETIGDEHTY